MQRWVVQVLVGLLVMLGLAQTARAEIPHRTLDLYTIGPGGDLVSRFGHSLICVREAGKDVRGELEGRSPSKEESGRCFDYGVAEKEDLVWVGWRAVRGVPTHIPVVVDEPVVIKFFKDQGRQIERQRLPMSAQQVEKLVTAIETEVRERRAYTYNPYWSNCSTKIRDHIDAATDGQLRPGPSSQPKGSFREYMEEGQSGHLDILTPMAIYLGEGNDRVPTPWEAMLLPAVLRDGVADRFHVKPEQLEERLAVVLPTSRAIGRIAVFLLAFLLLVAARVAARRGKLRAGLGIVGTFLGLLAITIEVVSATVKWPEISHNWSLLLILPTDLLLPYLTSKPLGIYLRARIAMAVLFVVLEIANVVHQPMIPLAVLVALPMMGILSALKEKAEDGAQAEIASNTKQKKAA